MDEPLLFKAPAGWGLANAALFFENEDLTGHSAPFAASLLVQLRMDVTPSTPRSTVRAKDLVAAEGGIPNLHVIGAGPLAMPDGGELEHLEWMFPDQAVETIRQLILYIWKGGRLYTVTATHQYDRFDAIRPGVLEVAQDLSKS